MLSVLVFRCCISVCITVCLVSFLSCCLFVDCSLCANVHVVDKLLCECCLCENMRTKKSTECEAIIRCRNSRYWNFIWCVIRFSCDSVLAEQRALHKVNTIRSFVVIVSHFYFSVWRKIEKKKLNTKKRSLSQRQIDSSKKKIRQFGDLFITVQSKVKHIVCISLN